MKTQTPKLTENFTVTVTLEVGDGIRRIAESENRKAGAITRILVEEALLAREQKAKKR